MNGVFMATAPANLDLFLSLLQDIDPVQAASLIPTPESSWQLTRPSDDSSIRSARRENSDTSHGSLPNTACAAPLQAVVRGAPSDPSSRRKREMRLTSKEQVAELEKQVAEKTAAVQMLSMNKTILNERLRMLEVVIAVRDHQMERVQAIKQGLTFNPFSVLSPLAASQSVVGPPCVISPSEMARKFLGNSAMLGCKLAAVSGDLQRFPFLYMGPQPGVPWPHIKVRVGANGETAPPLPERMDLWRADSDSGSTSSATSGLNSLPSGVSAATEQAPAATLAILQEVVQHMDKMMTGFQFKLFMSDGVMPFSFSIQAAMESPHTDWTSLISSAFDAVDESEPLPGAVPTVAPESHWAQVLEMVSMRPHQKLQSSVLLNIFLQCQAAVHAQRSRLATSMQRLQQRWLNSCAAGAADAGSGQGASDNTANACCAKPAEVLLEEEAIIQQLSNNLLKERCLISLATETLVIHVLSPVQVAILLAHSYPYFPDQVALLHAVAKQYDAQTSVRTSAQGYS